MAQWERAGPITQRSMDQNHPLLFFYYFNVVFYLGIFFFHLFFSLETFVRDSDTESENDGSDEKINKFRSPTSNLFQTPKILPPWNQRVLSTPRTPHTPHTSALPWWIADDVSLTPSNFYHATLTTKPARQPLSEKNHYSPYAGIICSYTSPLKEPTS